jgi:hypothetical protein
LALLPITPPGIEWTMVPHLGAVRNAGIEVEHLQVAGGAVGVAAHKAGFHLQRRRVRVHSGGHIA